MSAEGLKKNIMTLPEGEREGRQESADYGGTDARQAGDGTADGAGFR
jgi:hypothetical protein